MEKLNSTHQIVRTRLGKPFQHFRAAGGQQDRLNAQPPQPEQKQLPQGGGGAFGVDKDPVAVQQRLGRLLKALGVQPLQGLFQIELLAQHPAFHRKALLDFQQLGGRPGRLFLLGHQPL